MEWSATVLALADKYIGGALNVYQTHRRSDEVREGETGRERGRKEDKVEVGRFVKCVIELMESHDLSSIHSYLVTPPMMVQRKEQFHFQCEIALDHRANDYCFNHEPSVQLQILNHLTSIERRSGKWLSYRCVRKTLSEFPSPFS